MSAATWSCASCHAANARHRDRCLRCKSARPELVAATAAAAVASGALALPAAALPPPSAWAEALDVATRQIYYYNAATGETSWDRPAALGAAPLASGWFGRGAVGTSGAQAALLARNAAWLQRPARKQADLDPSRLQRAEGANEYNLWWGRFIGDSWRGGMGREPAPTRCAPEQDAGWTKATLAALTERAAFCIHFARGGCAKGSDCTYHHRIPSAEDDGALDTSRDVFGRERHASHRDDMGGVGSMMSNCRTLYVGGLKRPPEVAAAAASAALAGGGAAASGRSGGGGGGGGGSAALPPMPPPALMAAWESEVAAHFSPWGELESLNVIPRLAVAFVRYRYRAGAEFALAAMSNQSLGRGEVLNIRWAHDDPNPAAIAARARADEAAVTAALAARGIQLGVMAGPAEMPQPAAAAAAEEEGEAQRLEAHRAAQVAQWQEEMRAAGGGGAGWSEAAREAGGQAQAEEEEEEEEAAAAAAGAAAAQRKRARAAAAAEGEAAAAVAAAAAAHEAAVEAGAPAYTLGAAPPQLATYGSEAAAAGLKRQRAE